MKYICVLLISISLLACSNTTNEPLNESSSDDNQIEQPIKRGMQTIVDDEPLKSAEPELTVAKTEKEKATSSNDEKILEVKSIDLIQNDTENKVQEPVVIPQIDFSGVYPKILSSYVSSSGKVNYAQIKVNAEMLGQAITHYQENTPKSGWSTNQKLAYWINAYNLFTIKLIIDNYPVKSIKDIAGGKPWDKKFIQLDGKLLSLNDIENGIIRKDFNEPRIHFAVNCASISCPKLLNQEYTASNLNTQLEKQAKRYINDKNENSYTANSARLSNIFDWYKGDFDGGVIPFLNKYLETPLPENAKITYQEYNWNLNN